METIKKSFRLSKKKMLCLLLHPDGTDDTVVLNHESECKDVLGGLSLTFVGAIDECSVVALALEGCVSDVNVHCTDPDFFDVPVRGGVLIVGSAADGGRLDVDVERVRCILQKQRHLTDV